MVHNVKVQVRMTRVCYSAEGEARRVKYLQVGIEYRPGQ